MVGGNRSACVAGARALHRSGTDNGNPRRARCRRVVGGITGALIGVGIPEYEAKRYEGRLTKGGILISIHSDKTQDIAHAREIMERTGGEDISVSAEETPRAAKTAS